MVPQYSDTITHIQLSQDFAEGIWWDSVWDKERASSSLSEGSLNH